MPFLSAHGQHCVHAGNAKSMAEECWKGRGIHNRVFPEGDHTLLECRYIRMRYKFKRQSSSHLRFIDMDIDRRIAIPDLAMQIHALGLPDPLYILRNHENGHCHAVWALEKPIASTQARDWCRDIRRAMAHLLGADQGCTAVVSKNPLCPFWETRWMDPRTWQLADFNVPAVQEAAKISHIPDMVPGTLATGRNCTVFNRLRHWAYRHRHAYTCRDAWHQSVQSRASAYNAKYSRPMTQAEVRCIARSVSAWTWRRQFSFSSEKQRARGIRSAAVRQSASEVRNREIRTLSAQGMSIRGIAHSLQIPRSTVGRVIRQSKQSPQEFPYT